MFLRVQNQAKLDPVSSLFTFLPFWPPTNIDVNTENGSILVDISMARNLQGPLVNERRQWAQMWNMNFVEKNLGYILMGLVSRLDTLIE